MILVIDNYDSFTYNLVQYLGELGATLHVVRNDKLDFATLDKLSPKAVVISPGPGTPNDAGVSCRVLQEVSRTIPTLGVCLGHQCIGQVFGGVVTNAPRLMHGKTSMIRHNGRGIFAGLANPFEATRYHSLIVDEKSIPDCIEVTAWSEDDRLVMGMRHKELPIHGVQFHPESVLTGEGKRLLRNFIDLAMMA
ncbi:MAG: aminodeoxychorismate/anthranilate synthase component II [Candidatus Sumerlaeia bacterium]|jgi:anthranilate synthase component 2|nr:aminodeoxychorismate/anthranilate synthase component II [Candidatus Sumerlaeia bacterium]